MTACSLGPARHEHLPVFQGLPHRLDSQRIAQAGRKGSNEGKAFLDHVVHTTYSIMEVPTLLKQFRNPSKVASTAMLE